jgi:hypothetical protein
VLADVKKALTWNQTVKDRADYDKKKKEFNQKKKELADLADKINKVVDIQFSQRREYLGDANDIAKSSDKLVAALTASKDKSAQDLSKALKAFADMAVLVTLGIEVATPIEDSYDH